MPLNQHQHDERDGEQRPNDAEEPHVDGLVGRANFLRQPMQKPDTAPENSVHKALYF